MTNAKTVSAATVAAPIVAKPRGEYQEFADLITEKKQSLSAICFDAAIFARDNAATKEECAILKAVVSKQQWSDMGKIISCSHKLPKSAPTNLVKLAQYIRALDKGANAAQAKSHSEGKTNAKELTAAINGETAPAVAAPDLSDESAPSTRRVMFSYPFTMARAKPRLCCWMKRWPPLRWSMARAKTRTSKRRWLCCKPRPVN